MGILNLTADSFFDGGKYNSLDLALNQTEKMINDGALFIDVGAASSKPGSPLISSEEEKKKLLPILEQLLKEFPSTYLSIDTYNSEVAQTALEMGASMINDISGGQLDPQIIKTTARFKVPYIIMHMQGTPETMQIQPQYHSLVNEIKLELIQKVQNATSCGINDILIDPGFGFGKTVSDNYELLKHLSLFKDLNCPILVGLSRKSMIYRVLKGNAATALNGTTALHAWALDRGAHILRVHDVKEAKECVDLWTALQ